MSCSVCNLESNTHVVSYCIVFQDPVQTETVGELGVFLILFSCGLEFSPASFVKVSLGLVLQSLLRSRKVCSSDLINPVELHVFASYKGQN